MNEEATDASVRPASSPATSLEVRDRIVEALKLDLVGPWAGHPFENERLRAFDRPSNWYLTGFLIPTGTPPDKSGDADEDDDVEEIPSALGLPEESSEDRKAAKKGFFPSSMGISFLVPKEARSVTCVVRWGDYVLEEDPEQDEDEDGKREMLWQRYQCEKPLALALMGARDRKPED